MLFLSTGARLFVIDPNGIVQAQPHSATLTVTHGGSISGSVLFRGDVSLVERCQVTKDQKVCGTVKPSARLVIGKKGGVKNAVVYLQGVPQFGKVESPEKLSLNQRRCEYEPHIMIVPLGTEMEIVNSDPILHNVHAYRLEESLPTAFNIAQPIKGLRTKIKSTILSKAGEVSVTCDAGHPWMSGYLFVAPHRYYAVTDQDGKFLLENIPPGTYSIEMWHEGVTVAKKEMENGKVKKYVYEEPYKSEKSIRVSADENAKVDFELALR